MENFLLLVFIVIAGVLTIVTLKNENKIFGICASIALGISIVLYVQKDIIYIVSIIKQIISKLDNNTANKVGIIFKVGIMALLGEWVISVCKEAGEISLSTKLEIAIKILMIVLSVPILISLTDILISIIGEINNE